MRFRGREAEHPEFGQKVLDNYIEELSDIAMVESTSSPDGKSLSSYLLDKLDEKLKVTTGNPKIKAEIQKAIQTYMPLELSKELDGNIDLYGPTTVSKVDGQNKLIITIGKESVEVNTDTGTPTAVIIDKVTEAINKAREKVNENRMNPNKKEDDQNEPVDYSKK